MAVPTIVSITPNAGLSGGKTFVNITGTNFRLPSPPAATGKTTAPLDTVRVTFGGRVAERLLVVSATSLYVVTPFGDSGARPVVLTNLDNAGVAIPGETATAALGFTFKHPDLSSEQRLTSVVRAFIQELKRQVLENTVQTSHVDYDAETGDKLNTIATAALPAVVVVGPEIIENRFFSINQKRFVQDMLGFKELATPLTVDLVFEIVLLADTQQELLNLTHHAARFVDRNDYLKVPTNFSDPSAPTLDHEFDFAADGVFTARTLLGLSNVRQMTGRVVIRGVDLDDTADPTVSRTVEVVDLVVTGDVTVPAAVGFEPAEPEQLNPTRRIGPSPGEDRT